MPTIRKIYPTSSAGIARALKSAKDKQTSTPVPDRFLTNQTETRLNADQPAQLALRNTTASAAAAKLTQTALVEEAKVMGIRHVSHFIQVFDFGVLRKVYPKQDRAFYHLPTSDSKLPAMGTEQKLMEWVTNIITGDAARVLAGGGVMSNPTAAEVGIAGNDFDAKNIAQSPLKDAHDRALEAEKNAEPEHLGVIKKIWEEVETRYNEESRPSMRHKAREWGVNYEGEITNTFNIHVQDSITLAAVAGFSCELVQSGNVKTGNAFGDLVMKSKVIHEVTFEIIAANYVTQEVTVTLVDGQTVYDVVINLVHV